MFKKFLASTKVREDLKSSYLDMTEAAERLKRACSGAPCSNFSQVADMRHVRNPR